MAGESSQPTKRSNVATPRGDGAMPAVSVVNNLLLLLSFFLSLTRHSLLQTGQLRVEASFDEQLIQAISFKRQHACEYAANYLYIAPNGNQYDDS